MSSAVNFSSTKAMKVAFDFGNESPTPSPSIHPLNPIFVTLIAVTILLWRYAATDKLRVFPGPPIARWSSLWLGYHARKGHRYLTVDAAHKKYGPFVRIAPNHISIASKDALSVVYAQGSSAMNKSPFYRAFYVDGEPSMFSTQDRNEHSQKRRMLSQSFSYQSIRGFELFYSESIRLFVKKMDEICESNKPVDLLAWFNYLAFDIISDLAFGEPLGMIEKGTDLLAAEGKNGKVHYENAAALIDQRGRTAAVIGLMPSFESFNKRLPDPFISRGYQSTESLSHIARRCVKKRIESGAVRADILDRLIEGLKEKMQQQQIKEDDVVAEAMLLLTAGADTTANSTTAIIYHIFTHPEVHRKLLEELEGALSSNPLSLPTHEEVKNLRYLQATIDEGLRVFATNAFGLPRIVPEGGTVIHGQTIPEGTEVSVPAYTIQHDPSIWGDPEAFRPERWFEDGDLKRHLLTFGIGPRACIGKNLAYVQMQLAVATFVLRYTITLRDKELRSVEGFMHKPVDLWAKVSRRAGVLPESQSVI